MTGIDDGNITGTRRFAARVGVVMVIHAGLALLLAAAPRRDGTLGKTRQRNPASPAETGGCLSHASYSSVRRFSNVKPRGANSRCICSWAFLTAKMSAL